MALALRRPGLELVPRWSGSGLPHRVPLYPAVRKDSWTGIAFGAHGTALVSFRSWQPENSLRSWIARPAAMSSMLAVSWVRPMTSSIDVVLRWCCALCRAVIRWTMPPNQRRWTATKHARALAPVAPGGESPVGSGPDWIDHLVESCRDPSKAMASLARSGAGILLRFRRRWGVAARLPDHRRGSPAAHRGASSPALETA